jgi:hypothetical protein
MNVIFHVYPILLQRTQRARLAALLARSSAGRGSPGRRHRPDDARG